MATGRGDACLRRQGIGKSMYTVYVLRSQEKSWVYVGMSNNHLRRLHQHNRGQVRSTKFYKPFKLIYTRDFKTRTEARDYEKFLKIRSNKEKLIKTLSY